MNDPNGVPTDTGQTFTVTGIVTCGNHFGSSGPGAVQDQTAAISVYGSSFANYVQVGDSVTLTGKLTHFNGLTQLINPANLVKNETGKVITPLVVTISQINSQQWNGFEEYESELIRVNNVTIAGTGNFAYQNYNITDPTGTGQIRIDNDVTSILGTPIPSSPVDIIGVLSQYKSSPPYNSGYQLMPRFILDIVNDGSPVILNPIIAANIEPTSFTVYFQTARKGNSQIKYGLASTSLNDSIKIFEDTTNHKIVVNNLQPSTTYYYKVYSTNQYGTSSSGVQSVVTASNNPSLGKINIYFNYAVDTTVAIPGNAAIGSVNFTSKIIERINQSTYSIDMAVYSFNGLNDVVTALLNAKNRGVRIRIVYDHRDNQPVQTSMQSLLNAGIKMSRRPYVTYGGIMHNKFFVFDGRDSNPNNDWIWTGSFNLTSLEVNWKNNVVEINDPGLASAYTTEFEEMWGSNNENPNPSTAKFGPAKTNNTPHTFNVGGKEVLLYFSPSDGTNAQIINAVNTANNSMYFAQYTFTRSDIRIAMNNRKQAGANDMRGIIDQATDPSSQYSQLQSFCEMFDNSSPTLHHKYAIVDATHSLSNPLVITGSHNWSNSAEQDNDENTLIIKDVRIANQYMQEFKKRYNELGGIGTFIIPNNVVYEIDAPIGFNLYQNYPNPFNPVTTIRIEVGKSSHVNLELFDVLGNKVATLYKGEVKPGLLVVDFNSNLIKPQLTSGIYFYKLTADGYSGTRKLMLLK
jgi:phosphatidylserine/phosphatidylglycerophosphate/cardiolipin synthase-like enzyme